MQRITANLIEAGLPIAIGIYILRAGDTLLRRRGDPPLESMDPERLAKRRKSFRLLAMGLLVFGSWNGIRALIVSTPQRTDLAQVAATVRSKLPLQVDEDTRWDDLTALDGEALFTYTLTRARVGELDKVAFRKDLEQRFLASACSHPQIGKLLADGVLLSLRYRDRDGAEVAEILVPPSTCGHADSAAVRARVTAAKDLQKLEGKVPELRSPAESGQR